MHTILIGRQFVVCYKLHASLFSSGKSVGLNIAVLAVNVSDIIMFPLSMKYFSNGQLKCAV